MNNDRKPDQFEAQIDEIKTCLDEIMPKDEVIEEAMNLTEEKVMSESEQVAKLETELTAVSERERDTALRARAEIENIRRRAEQDVTKAHRFALERFSNELLPVIDNLERALTLSDKDNPALTGTLEGIELTLKSLLDAVKKFGIEVVDAVNVPFDPEVHQAMTSLPSDAHEPNHIIDVMQKGYTLNGRLLRPAMVVVSKAKE